MWALRTCLTTCGKYKVIRSNIASFFIYIPVSLQIDEQGRIFLISWNNPDTEIS